MSNRIVLYCIFWSWDKRYPLFGICIASGTDAFIAFCIVLHRLNNTRLDTHTTNVWF
jgi:hypothetical protein